MPCHPLNFNLNIQMSESVIFNQPRSQVITNTSWNANPICHTHIDHETDIWNHAKLQFLLKPENIHLHPHGNDLQIKYNYFTQKCPQCALHCGNECRSSMQDNSSISIFNIFFLISSSSADWLITMKSNISCLISFLGLKTHNSGMPLVI